MNILILIAGFLERKGLLSSRKFVFNFFFVYLIGKYLDFINL